MRSRKKQDLMAHKPAFLPLLERVHSCPALEGSKGQVPLPCTFVVGDKAVLNLVGAGGHQLKQEVTW